MKALVWHGKEDIRCDSVPDPHIEAPTDAIIKVTSCAICGSDLHLFNNFIPGMKKGDVMGHETMGIVQEVGSAVTKLRVGERVVIPFTIFCGDCEQCQRGFYSACERTNPNKKLADAASATAAPDCSATPTSPADIQADRPNTFACRSRIPLTSKCRRTISATISCCS